MPIISSAKVHNTGDSPPRSPGLRPGTSHTDEGGNITRINSRPSTASYGGAPSPSETSSSDDSSGKGIISISQALILFQL